MIFKVSSEEVRSEVRVGQSTHDASLSLCYFLLLTGIKSTPVRGIFSPPAIAHRQPSLEKPPRQWTCLWGATGGSPLRSTGCMYVFALSRSAFTAQRRRDNLISLYYYILWIYLKKSYCCNWGAHKYETISDHSVEAYAIYLWACMAHIPGHIVLLILYYLFSLM